ELVLVGHRERPRRARLDAQPAEDAPQVVDLVDAAVALTRREPLLRGVVGALDVDRVRRARPRAQLAADALLQAVGPAVQLVTAVEARRRGLLDLGVLHHLGLAEHLVESDAEPLDRVQEIKHGWPPQSWTHGRCRRRGSAARRAAAPGTRPPSGRAPPRPRPPPAVPRSPTSAPRRTSRSAGARRPGR